MCLMGPDCLPKEPCTISAACPSLPDSSWGAWPEAFACLDGSAAQNTGSVSPSENSLHHAAPQGGTPTLPWDASRCPWKADCGCSDSLRPRVSWSPGTSFSPLLYETREQGISVMGFGPSLGNRAKCVSLPSCFLKDAIPLPNSSEPGPHAA